MRVESDLGHMPSSGEEFYLTPIHPPFGRLFGPSESFYEDLHISHNPMKLYFLHLIFSSSSELEESSLEKSKSLKAAYARDMIF
jgi:hypothetical protein